MTSEERQETVALVEAMIKPGEIQRHVLTGAMLVLLGVVLELATREWGSVPGRMLGASVANVGLQKLGIEGRGVGAPAAIELAAKVVSEL